MKNRKHPMHPILAAGLALSFLWLLAHRSLNLPDFAAGFVEGVCIGLVILGAVLTLIAPERLERLKGWKRKHLFGGNGSC